MDPVEKVVALIRKDRGPSFNIGKWNGIGGKVETGEGIRSCMSREFQEETGLLVAADEWYGFHLEKHPARAEQMHEPRIHFMVANVSLERLREAASVTSEEVRLHVFPNIYYLSEDYVYNLPYLLHMAFCWLHHPQHRWIEG